MVQFQTKLHQTDIVVEYCQQAWIQSRIYNLQHFLPKCCQTSHPHLQEKVGYHSQLEVKYVHIQYLQLLWMHCLHRSGQNEVDVGIQINDGETNLLVLPWYCISPVSKFIPPPHANRKWIQFVSEKSSGSPVSLTRENLTVVTPSTKEANALSTFCISSIDGWTRSNAYLCVQEWTITNIYT